MEILRSFHIYATPAKVTAGIVIDCARLVGCVIRTSGFGNVINVNMVILRCISRVARIAQADYRAM